MFVVITWKFYVLFCIKNWILKIVIECIKITEINVIHKKLKNWVLSHLLDISYFSSITAHLMHRWNNNNNIARDGLFDFQVGTVCMYQMYRFDFWYIWEKFSSRNILKFIRNTEGELEIYRNRMLWITRVHLIHFRLLDVSFVFRMYQKSIHLILGTSEKWSVHIAYSVSARYYQVYSCSSYYALSVYFYVLLPVFGSR